MSKKFHPLSEFSGIKHIRFVPRNEENEKSQHKIHVNSIFPEQMLGYYEPYYDCVEDKLHLIKTDKNTDTSMTLSKKDVDKDTGKFTSGSLTPPKKQQYMEFLGITNPTAFESVITRDPNRGIKFIIDFTKPILDKSAQKALDEHIDATKKEIEAQDDN